MQKSGRFSIVEPDMQHDAFLQRAVDEDHLDASGIDTSLISGVCPSVANQPKAAGARVGVRAA